MAFPKEVGFGTDDKGKPLVYSPSQSLSQIFFNIFMMEPNTYPTDPNKGIGIQRYLYMTEDEIDVSELKNKIFMNCADLISYIELDDIQIIFTEHEGQGIILTLIPVKVTNESLLIAFLKDEKNEIQYKFQVESMKLN